MTSPVTSARSSLWTLCSRLFSVLLVLACAVPALAALVKFDIPAQTADKALPQFIAQADVSVMFNRADLKGVQLNAVVGEYEPDVALGELLAGTGFAAARAGDGKYAVVKEAALTGTVDGSVREAKTARPVAGAKVAIAGTDKTAVTDNRGRFTISEVRPGDYELTIIADGMRNTQVTDVTVKAGHRHSLSAIEIPAKQEGAFELEPYRISAKKNDGIIELDPMDVEGRREKPFVAGNMDIPRTVNDVQPYYIFNSATIDTSGAANVEDFLKQRLTMNTTALTNAQSAGGVDGHNGNTSTINLRGLGADKTLVLINGRRVAGVVRTGSTTFEQQPDLNGIPLSAIERIEVLPSSASGIYGGSAIGGVVNVILKKDYSGGEIRMNYDNTWDADAPRRSLSFSYGLALENGRTHLAVSASWADEKPLLLQDRRALLEQSIATILANSPSYIYTSTTPWLGSLPNIYSLDGTLRFTDGTVLNAGITHVPAGTSASTSRAELIAGLGANAGRWNLDLPASAQNPTGLLRQFGATTKLSSLQASIRRQMSPYLELFSEFGYSDNRATAIYHPLANDTIFVAPSAYSPFANNVRVLVPDNTQLPQVSRSVNKTASIGAIINLPWDWTAAIDYSWSQNHFETSSYGREIGIIGTDVSNGVLNPFVDTLRYPLDLAKYWYPSSHSGTSNLSDASVRATGHFLELPWGRPTLTLGGEHRVARSPERSSVTDRPLSPTRSFYQKYFARESQTVAGYAEALIPLVQAGRFAMISDLELQIAARSERYNVDTGTAFEQIFYGRTPVATSYTGPTLDGKPYFSEAKYMSSNSTIGLQYRPHKAVAFRVSSATAFLPPLPSQLVKDPLPASFLTTVSDPKTATQYSVQTIGGGNPDLKPQNSKSFNAGLIWEPNGQRLNGLRFNAEYYRIEQFDYIASLSAQQLLAQEDVYGERITRNSSGVITLIDTSMVNLFRLESTGLDLSVAYSLRTGIGTFNITAVESRIASLRTQYAQATPEYEAAGYHPAEGGAPKRKSALSIVWERGPLSAGWSARYSASYKQYGADGGPQATQIGSALPQWIAAQGSDTVASQMYHDVFLSVDFGLQKTGTTEISKLGGIGRKLLSDMKLQFGVRNLFDKAPPFDVFYGSTNFYLSPYGDTRLRSYWLSLRKSF